MADSGFKGISRIDQPHKRNHGWYVRVDFKKKKHSKFFSDARHGGRTQALQEAVKYRNELERALGKPRTERVVVGTPPGNREGVVGVVRAVKSTRDPKGKLVQTPVYEVTWCPEPNRIRRTSFSIEKYGEQEAFRRAYTLRKKAEREIYGAEIPVSPKTRDQADLQRARQG